MVSKEIKEMSDVVAADIAKVLVSIGSSKEVVESMANDLEKNWSYFNKDRFMKLCGL